MRSERTWLVELAHATYSKLIIRKRKLTITNNTKADLENGPYLIISNHVRANDAVVISSLMDKRNISWVTGAYLFKMGLLRLILGHFCKCIPKQQGRADLSSIRNIQRALKEGKLVGIFPEGTRTWDGELMPVNYRSLAKMIKIFKMPVVFMHFEGGFASFPRWADVPRKGPTNVNIKHLLSAEEIESLSVDELKSKIEEYQYFSNDEWKTEENYKYVSDRRAEGIQRLFYMCPICHQLEVIESSGNTFKCRNCGAEGSLDEMDNIVSEKFPFKLMSQWHKWEAAEVAKEKGFVSEKGVLFQVGDSNNDGKLKTLSKNINVELKDNCIIVKCNNSGKEHILPLDHITSLILNAKQTMELFCDDILYRIRLLPDSSSLKYHEYYLAHNSEKTAESV